MEEWQGDGERDVAERADGAGEREAGETKWRKGGEDKRVIGKTTHLDVKVLTRTIKGSLAFPGRA